MKPTLREEEKRIGALAKRFIEARWNWIKIYILNASCTTMCVIVLGLNIFVIEHVTNGAFLSVVPDSFNKGCASLNQSILKLCLFI